MFVHDACTLYQYSTCICRGLSAQHLVGVSMVLFFFGGDLLCYNCVSRAVGPIKNSTR